MRIQPRQQLLDAWRAIARSSVREIGNFQRQKEWIWADPSRRNSISDAEQLLCLLGPATEIPTFKLDLPNETAGDVAQVLAALGDPVEIPRLLSSVIEEYLLAYTDESGAPTFAGGSYFRTAGSEPPAKEQLALDVVDSYAASVRLSLGVIGFARVFRGILSRPELRQQVRTIEDLANRRLTAAMIGLVRSFAVSVFDQGTPEVANICAMVNQSGLSSSRFREAMNNATNEVRAGLRDITPGHQDIAGLDNENKFFECGWSWGIVNGMAPVPTNATGIPQPEGVALDAPYLYFTAVALECIQSLFSQRTRMLGLLTEEQQRLARALQIRWDLAQQYWSTIARFGTGRWPLEDMPWRTADGIQSDYLTLLVSSIVFQELPNRASVETDTWRLSKILEELAARARITYRILDNSDPAIALHSPGFPFVLEGSENAGGPRLTWELADFSPQLLKQTMRLATMIGNVRERERVVDLADRIWEEHLVKRRLTTGRAAGLWDRAAALYPSIAESDEPDEPSWYYTERVVGCLVSAAQVTSGPPLRSHQLTGQATDLLAEADHMYDQELMRITGGSGPAMRKALDSARASLRRAHEVLGSRPGTAAALASQVLLDLDRLDAARRDANETD